ncbi:MAG TPA: hypothetical protein VGF67_12360 [Ktedonobacteraceae bacterium]|jgi:hypothetical protein
MVNLDILIGALIGALAGFVLGLLSWGVQQWWQAHLQQQRVRVLLQRENAQNLKVLDQFWQYVTNTSGDQDTIEKYQRAADTHLSAWDHRMWENQASLLSLLDERSVTRMYELNRNLDDFLLLRQRMHKALERGITFGGPSREEESAFSKRLDLIWNDIATLYNTIHNEGNPIAKSK